MFFLQPIENEQAFIVHSAALLGVLPQCQWVQVPICVATSSHKRHFDLKTQQHGTFFENFDHIITGDNVTNGKPAPDIFLMACETWQTPPSPGNCLVFEDAPTGVAAAKAAGMHCVMVPDPNLDRASTKQADVAVCSILETPLGHFGLPEIPKEWS